MLCANTIANYIYDDTKLPSTIQSIKHHQQGRHGQAPYQTQDVVRDDVDGGRDLFPTIPT